MRVFLRRLTENDTKKQVETTTEIYKYFFDGDERNPEGVIFSVKKNSVETVEFKVSKAAGNANSYRFSSANKGGISFGSFISEFTSNGYKANDILIMYKNNDAYTLDIIESNSAIYELLSSWIPKKQNTIVLSDDNNEKKSIDDKIIDLSSLSYTKCAKLIFDTIYEFDNMRRIHDLFVKTDKYIKIDPKEIQNACRSSLRYVFIQSESTMFNSSNSEGRNRVFDDVIYKLNVNESDVKVKLSSSWEYKDVDQDGSNNNLKVLIEIINLKYQGLIKIVYNEDEKNLYILSSDLIGYNKIYYGIPGCGKSYYVENTVLKDVDKENDVFRTTFYLDYSNADFIGQIYPSVEDDKVTYIRVPGPFTEALEQAIKNPDRMIYLVIEEINRGNASAIFGDTFQLLDRLKEDKNGRVKGDSEYPVSNTFIEGYFKANDIPYTPGQIYIPHNLTILATMNTSDQNVFPLDTAFKRRWDREKVVNDWNTVGDIKDYYVPYTDIKWKTFATTINNSMLETNSNSDVTISEDKQMGAYFAQKNMLTKNANEKDKEALRAFTSNVIDYLYNDVTKFDHSLLFEKEINSYDNLYTRVSKYTKALLSTPNNTDVGPHAVLSKFLKEDIVKKLEENAKEDNKDKKSVEENIETDGAENEGTEN